MAKDFIFERRPSGPSHFYPNTELAVNLKLLTHQSGRMPQGAHFNGLLRRDGEDHFTFLQTQPSGPVKRNPHAFVGRWITSTRRDDGSLRLNCRPARMGREYNIAGYASGVQREIAEGLSGLVGEGGEGHGSLGI